MESNKLVFISDWITETDKPNYRTKLYLRLDDECKTEYVIFIIEWSRNAKPTDAGYFITVAMTLILLGSFFLLLFHS